MSDPSHVSTQPRPLGQPNSSTPPKITTPTPLGHRPKDDLSSLSIVEDQPGASGPAAANKIKITAYGVSGLQEKTYKRHSNLTGNGAVHVKSFHGILSDEGLQRLDDKINEWLEGHGDLEVKFVTSNIGIWHGKTSEPALIMHVWY